MTAAVSDIVDEFLPWVPGCPGMVARREIVRAAQRFCRETRVIQVDVDAFTLAASSSVIDLNDHVDDQSRAIACVALQVDGLTIRSVTLERLRQSVSDFKTRLPGFPLRRYQTDDHLVQLWPVTDKAYPVTLTVATMPKDNATQLPDSLGSQWREAICGGAMQKLCSIPGQPYTNLDYAQLGSLQFAKGVHDAKVEVNRSFGDNVRATMRPFV